MIQALSPCVTFRGAWDPSGKIKANKDIVPDDHDPTDAGKALELARREDKFRFGIYYQPRDVPTFGDRLDIVAAAAQETKAERIEDVLKEFVQ